ARARGQGTRPARRGRAPLRVLTRSPAACGAQVGAPPSGRDVLRRIRGEGRRRGPRRRGDARLRRGTRAHRDSGRESAKGRTTVTLFVLSTVKLSLVIVAGLGTASLLRGRSAALRHWVLAVALLCAAIVPALELVVPAWDLPHREVATVDAVIP